MTIKIIVTLCIGYLLGSIPWGYIVGKIKKVDLREKGFKKIGASNVYKTIGFLPAVLVFFADFVKGIIPVLIGKGIGLPESVAVFGGLTAVIGHTWPLWLKFKGEGRGVATSTGLVYYLLPREVLTVVVLLIILASFMKSTAFPVFICFLLIPFVAWLFKEPSWLINFAGILFGLLIIVRLTGLTRVPRGKRKKAILSLLLFDRIPQ